MGSDSQVEYGRRFPLYGFSVSPALRRQSQALQTYALMLADCP